MLTFIFWQICALLVVLVLLFVLNRAKEFARNELKYVDLQTPCKQSNQTRQSKGANNAAKPEAS